MSQSLKLSLPDQINDRRALQEENNIKQFVLRLNAQNFYLRKVRYVYFFNLCISSAYKVSRGEYLKGK